MTSKPDASPKSIAELLIEKLEARVSHAVNPSMQTLGRNQAFVEAIAIIRQHRPEQAQDVVEDVKGSLQEQIDKAFAPLKDIAAMGDGSATIAPVSAETVPAMTPAKLHFSDCSIYDESGTEMPGAECDCGGCVEDKNGSPEWVKRLEEQPQPREISVAPTFEDWATREFGLSESQKSDLMAGKFDGNLDIKCLSDAFDAGRKTKPVSVSLETCAKAHFQAVQKGGNLYDVTKAVLDAAGVTYVA